MKKSQHLRHGFIITAALLALLVLGLPLFYPRSAVQAGAILRQGAASGSINKAVSGSAAPHDGTPQATEPAEQSETPEATEPRETETREPDETRTVEPRETEPADETETEQPHRTGTPPTRTPVVTATSAVTRTPTRVEDDLPGSGSRFFPQTNKSVKGIFLSYWEGHGGVKQQGYPISDARPQPSNVNWGGSQSMSNKEKPEKVYMSQYFERAVFEYHPENAAPFNVLLSLLGSSRYAYLYPNGGPNQHANTTDGQFFSQTGHWAGGVFLNYWRENGGLMQQGYPISDEFMEVSAVNGRPYLVQYFERAVFEYHPENAPPYNVLLTPLGALQYQALYGK